LPAHAACPGIRSPCVSFAAVDGDPVLALVERGGVSIVDLTSTQQISGVSTATMRRDSDGSCPQLADRPITAPRCAE